MRTSTSTGSEARNHERETSLTAVHDFMQECWHTVRVIKNVACLSSLIIHNIQTYLSTFANASSITNKKSSPFPTAQNHLMPLALKQRKCALVNA